MTVDRAPLPKALGSRVPAGRPGLIRNSLWAASGLAALGLCRWVVFVLLARWCTPEVVGQYALALAIATPWIQFSRLRLRAVQAGDAEQRYQLGHYTALTILTTVIGLFVVLLLVLLSGYDSATGLAVMGVAFVLALESGSELCYGALQRHERMDSIGCSMMLRSALIIVGVWIALMYRADVLAVISGMVIAGAGALLGHDLPVLIWGVSTVRCSSGMAGPTESIVPIWDWKSLMLLTGHAAPLGVASLVSVLTVALPRYALDLFHGLRDLGLFALMATIMIPGNIVVLGFTQAALPRLSTRFAGGDAIGFRRHVAQLVGLALLVGFGCVLAVLAAGDWMISTVYSREYAGGQPVLNILIISAAVTYVGYALSAAVVSMRRFWSLLIIHLASLVLTLILSFAWIAPYGVRGAAWSLLITSIAGTVALLAFVDAQTRRGRFRDGTNPGV